MATSTAKGEALCNIEGIFLRSHEVATATAKGEALCKIERIFLRATKWRYQQQRVKPFVK